MCSILFYWAIGSSQVSHAFSGGFKGCKLMGKVCQFPPWVADCAEDLKYNPAKFFEATELRNEPWARTHECQVPSIFQLYPQSIPIISPLHPHSILSPWYPIKKKLTIDITTRLIVFWRGMRPTWVLDFGSASRCRGIVGMAGDFNGTWDGDQQNCTWWIIHLSRSWTFGMAMERGREREREREWWMIGAFFLHWQYWHTSQHLTPLHAISQQHVNLIIIEVLLEFMISSFVCVLKFHDLRAFVRANHVRWDGNAMIYVSWIQCTHVYCIFVYVYICIYINI